MERQVSPAKETDNKQISRQTKTTTTSNIAATKSQTEQFIFRLMFLWKML